MPGIRHICAVEARADRAHRRARQPAQPSEKRELPMPRALETGSRTALAAVRSVLRASALLVVLATGAPAVAEAAFEAANEAAETIELAIAWRARARAHAVPSARAALDLGSHWRDDQRRLRTRANVRGAAHASVRGAAPTPLPLRC